LTAEVAAIFLATELAAISLATEVAAIFLATELVAISLATEVAATMLPANALTLFILRHEFCTLPMFESYCGRGPDVHALVLSKRSDCFPFAR
jgi:hypothetical protein